MDTRPIGIFDSGVGGLTVADKVFKLLPQEKIIYCGDTARVPYGNKSKETVTRFSKEIVKFLLKFRVKLIVVACNTASSLSLDSLRHAFSIPIMGVIKPGVKEALEKTGNRRVGVIGTESTISSNAYRKEVLAIDKSVFVIQKSCPLFVPLVEERMLYDAITRMAVKRYLSPVLKKKIDTLILGCTHYPLLENAIQKFVGKKVSLVDSSMAVARYTKSLLKERNMLSGQKRKAESMFFASDNTKNFARLAKVFLKREINPKRVIF